MSGFRYTFLLFVGAEGKMGEDVHLILDGSEEHLETFLGG